MKTLGGEAVYPLAFETNDDVNEHLPYFVEEVYTNVGSIQRSASWVTNSSSISTPSRLADQQPDPCPPQGDYFNFRQFETMV